MSEKKPRNYMKKVYCPFKNPERDTTCTEDCALFDREFDGCAILSIARKLKEV